MSAIEEVWHALKPPYTELFAWVEGRSERPDPGSIPVFRPMMLAHPVEEADWPTLDPTGFAAEWKWDGIRVQVAAKAGEVRVYSRTGDDISPAFPEIRSAFAHFDVVADGELLVVRQGNGSAVQRSPAAAQPQIGDGENDARSSGSPAAL